MPELRMNVITGEWVIIAKERSKRPHDFMSPHESKQGANCVFCYGNENKTPEEVYAVRPEGSKPNQPGWLVRIFPNKFPAVTTEVETIYAGEKIESGFPAVGIHEVVVDTFNHSENFASISDAQAELALLAIAERYNKLCVDQRVKYVQVFKNHGPTAGASLEHSHWQIVTVPVIPDVIGRELEGAEKFYKQHGKCVFCNMVAEEIKEDQRVILNENDFVALAPYASRFPGEVWIIPKKHRADFKDLPTEELKNLGRFVRHIAMRLDLAFNAPPYNLVLHSSPPQTKYDTYHWHLKLIPRLSIAAGFELGTGIYINPTPPEICAVAMREAGIF